jgi:hypothetical protein
LKRLAELLPEIASAVGLGLWLLVGVELLSAYLKALGLGGAAIGDLGIAIVEIGQIPSSLAMLLTLTVVIWIASERLVRGEPVLHRLLPIVVATCALLMAVLAAAIHAMCSADVDPDKLRLFGGLTWPLLVFSFTAVALAGAICALFARATDGRPWAVALAALPALAALGFYTLVTRSIADYGVEDAPTLPLIFPRPWSIALGLALPIAVAIGLWLLGRRRGGTRPLRSALLAAAPLAYALHALVCLGTASPLELLAGFAIDDGARRANELGTWILAALFGVAWVVLFAIQRRRYLKRRQPQTKTA